MLLNTLCVDVLHKCMEFHGYHDLDRSFCTIPQFVMDNYLGKLTEYPDIFRLPENQLLHAFILVSLCNSYEEFFTNYVSRRIHFEKRDYDLAKMVYSKDISFHKIISAPLYDFCEYGHAQLRQCSTDYVIIEGDISICISCLFDHLWKCKSCTSGIYQPSNYSYDRIYCKNCKDDRMWSYVNCKYYPIAALKLIFF